MNIFAMAPTPGILFGEGTFQRLPSLLPVEKGQTVLLIRSGSFGEHSEYWALIAALRNKGVITLESVVRSEPTPDLVNAIVSFHLKNHIAVVLGVGGGSVLDTAKAVAAMMTVTGPVEQYLEGVGTEQHPGTRLPLVLCPTTAGTGSEATKNAVLSKSGANGYKRSLRHEQFIPDLALIDPSLMISLPLQVAAASGMDALTQLLEAYLSVKANPMTDALCAPAIGLCIEMLEQLPDIWSSESRQSEKIDVMNVLAYSATISGIALANAGLGTVHGFAASIGGVLDAPHGVICGTLLAPVLLKMVGVLEVDKTSVVWRKLAGLAKVSTQVLESSVKNTRRILPSVKEWVLRIEHLRTRLGLTSLSAYGLTPSLCHSIATATGNKESAVPLDTKTLEEILLLVCG